MVYCHEFFFFFCLIYICGTLITVSTSWISFSCIYLRYFFFVTHVFSFETYCHIVMVGKYTSPKIDQTAHCTLHQTTPYRTYDCKIEVRCSDGFDQTAPQSAVLKMAQYLHWIRPRTPLFGPVVILFPIIFQWAKLTCSNSDADI